MVPFEPLRRSVLAPTVSAADRARRVGTLSDYRILQTLGKGNFGTVSKIIRLRDKKLLVWKEVRYHNMSNRDRLQLVAEVNVLKMLDHPHIVQYVERIVDKPGMRLLIVMAYCVNGDLSELLRSHVMKQEFLAETMVLSTFSQLVDAIKYCHSRCILHRDIKPSNIFLDDNNNIRLGDFGLARMLPKDVLATTNVGTPYYQSPEMLLGQAYNEKSDIWALGCILYEMAMLKIPFDAKDYKHLMHIVCKGNFVPVSSAYSAELRQLVPWTLHKYSSARPTAEQLAHSPALRDRIQYDKSQPKVFSPEENTGGLARYCKPKDAKTHVHDEVTRDTADQTRDTADQETRDHVDREPSPDRPLGNRIQWADDLADLFVKKADKENRPHSVQEKRIPALRECHSHGTLRLRMPRRPIPPLATPVAIAQQCAPGGNRVYSAKDSPGLKTTHRPVTRGSPKRDTAGRSPSMSPLFPTPAGRIYPPPVWNSKPSLPLGRTPLARCHSNPRSALPKDTYPLLKAVDAALRRNPTYAIRTDIQTCTPDALPVVSPGAIAQPTLHRVETSLEELRCLRKDILSREGQLMEREAQLRDKEERLIKCEAHIRRKEHKYAHHAAIRAEQLDAREIRLLQWQDSIRLEPA